MKRITKAEIAKFDFLDFGASTGGSIEFAKKRLFGKRGLGVDLDPKRVAIMKKAGYDCIVGDLCDLEAPPKSVKFVIMSHILEHLPDLKMVEQVVATAAKVAKDYLVITGPFFDEDRYLAKKGFKLHWSDYWDHPCHLTIPQLEDILKKLSLKDYEMHVRYPIICSTNDEVHPLESPSDTKQYSPKLYPPKKHKVFRKDVWTDFVCYVRLGEVTNWSEVTKAYKNTHPYRGPTGVLVRIARLFKDTRANL